MPGAVKGSKQVRMTVVPYRPWLRSGGLVAAVFLAALASVAGYIAGYQRGGENLTALTQNHEQSLRELGQVTSTLAEIRAQVSVLDRTRLVDQQVNEQAQATISGLRAQISALERDVTLYRQVMAMESAEAELSLQQWELATTELPGVYRYRLVISQFGGSGNAVNARLSMQLEGQRGVEVQLVPFNDISEQFSGAAMSLTFRYLFVFEGDIVMPEGLEPQRVHVQLSAEQSAYKALTESFDWQPIGGR